MIYFKIIINGVYNIYIFYYDEKAVEFISHSFIIPVKIKFYCKKVIY